MTVKQLAKLKDKYLKSKGMVCPFCGSSRLTGDDQGGDGYTAQQEVVCECGKTWTDIYELVDVEFD